VNIGWGTLGAIAAAAAAAALAVVLLVSFALVGLSAARPRPGADSPDDGGAPGTHTATGTAVAALCLFTAGLIVCYGLYLIIA
jgi:hypothetical protein